MELEFNHAMESRKRDSPTTHNVPTKPRALTVSNPKLNDPKTLPTKQSKQNNSKQSKHKQQNWKRKQITSLPPAPTKRSSVFSRHSLKS